MKARPSVQIMRMHTGHPRDFARILVGAQEIDLRHVEQHGANHEVGSPIVHRPHVPSEVLFVGQIEKAVVGFRGRGHVDEGQQAARDNLKDKTKQGGAAKNVEPAGGTLGNRVPGRVLPQAVKCGAVCRARERGLARPQRRVVVSGFFGSALIR